MADIVPGLASNPWAGLAQGIASAGQGYFDRTTALAQMRYQSMMAQAMMNYRMGMVANGRDRANVLSNHYTGTNLDGTVALDGNGNPIPGWNQTQGQTAAARQTQGQERINQGYDKMGDGDTMMVFKAIGDGTMDPAKAPAALAFLRSQHAAPGTDPSPMTPGTAGNVPAMTPGPAMTGTAMTGDGGLTPPAPPAPSTAALTTAASSPSPDGSVPPPAAGPGTLPAAPNPLADMGPGPMTLAKIAQMNAGAGQKTASTMHLGDQDQVAFANLIGLLPPGQQAGAVADWNARNGTNYPVPVQTGSRPLNYGLNPAQASNVNGLRQILGQSQDPNATVSFGGKTYNRAQFATAFPPGQAAVWSGLYAPTALQGAGIAQKQASAASSNANATTLPAYRQGLVANGQTAAGAAVTKANTYAATQPIIAKADSTRAAAAATTANTGASRLGFDQFKYGNPPVSPADTAALIKQQQATIDQQNRAKNYLLTRRDKSGSQVGLTANDQAVIAAADSQIQAATHNIRAFQRGVNPVTGQPLNRAVQPMPVTGVTSGTGQPMPGVSVPQVPPLPGFGQAPQGSASDPMLTIKGRTLPRSQWQALRARMGK